MQGGNNGGGNLAPPPSGRIISSPNPNSTYPQAADPAIATAHMIGKNYPTPADFASLMSSGYAPSPQVMEQAYQQQQQPILNQNLSSKSGWFNDILNQLRQPILVALIVFVMSMPVIHILKVNFSDFCVSITNRRFKIITISDYIQYSTSGSDNVSIM